ncbi:hypothetical protein [Sphingobacterium cellulitidis]|uniref:hypothetical protein n=1 Tax=Sphingobacterium cellulitidis TaxID=1768011 RepID=UPI0011404F3C
MAVKFSWANPHKPNLFRTYRRHTQTCNVDGTYGGSIAADNSGILKYVRNEFADFNFTEDTEINGLTCEDGGSGTTLEDIQVSWVMDDAKNFSEEQSMHNIW